MLYINIKINIYLILDEFLFRINKNQKKGIISLSLYTQPNFFLQHPNKDIYLSNVVAP